MDCAALDFLTKWAHLNSLLCEFGGRKTKEVRTKEMTSASMKRNFPQTILPILALLSGLLMTAPVLSAQKDSHPNMHEHMSSQLVQDVRNATKQYIDVNNATAAGYGPFLGCVSGPDHGAMGIHYVNGGLVTDGKIDVTQPEALIYEPSNGKLRLVGVEYIVDAATWLANNNGTPPVLDGQVFQLVGTPNRYNIPAPFFELHVWAWRDNPQGAFVDWNNRVSCDGE